VTVPKNTANTELGRRLIKENVPGERLWMVGALLLQAPKARSYGATTQIDALSRNAFPTDPARARFVFDLLVADAFSWRSLAETRPALEERGEKLVKAAHQVQTAAQVLVQHLRHVQFLREESSISDAQGGTARVDLPADVLQRLDALNEAAQESLRVLTTFTQRRAGATRRRPMGGRRAILGRPQYVARLLATLPVLGVPDSLPPSAREKRHDVRERLHRQIVRELLGVAGFPIPNDLDALLRDAKRLRNVSPFF
jgi:hypothetical protein